MIVNYDPFPVFRTDLSHWHLPKKRYIDTLIAKKKLPIKSTEKRRKNKENTDKTF